MPSTHTSLHYHLVFSTKNRETWFSGEFLPRLHAYLGGIIRNMDGHPHAVGGVADHVHTFQEEYLEFLKRGLVEYDERFLW